jgi:hypothetical protein
VNTAQRLVRMYPRSFRERWGDSLESEVEGTGWGSWPGLAAHVALMWLHPAIWPADSRAQRRQRAATMAITIAAACWYLTYAAAELGTPVARTWPMTACTALMLLGLVLVAPRPRLTLGAVRTALRRAAGRFAAPAILGAVVVTAVHAEVYTAAPGVLRPVLLSGWWTVLALAAVRSCRIVADLGAEATVPPKPGRLRLGLLTLAVSATVPAPILLGASVAGGHLDPLSAVAGAGLLALMSAFVGTLRDVRHLRATD